MEKVKSNIEDEIVERIKNLFSQCKISTPKKKHFTHDIILEIPNPLSNNDKRLTHGFKFFVNIFLLNDHNKSINIDASLIKDMLASPTPILLLCFHRKQFCYLWLDEKLKEVFDNKNNWLASKKIEIPIAKCTKLSEEEIPKIEKYVFSWQRGIVSKIPKGTFFEIRNLLKNNILEFFAYLNTNNIKCNKEPFEKLLEKTENAIYTIAIVGPSRSGKSTLFNALTGLDISPVDTLPTTGVPFTIQPGKKNESEIVFFDNNIKRGPANAKFLEKYITQKYNPNNQENVKLVTVYLESEKLEKGLSFCDVPGLDDPNPEIQRISKIAVYSSNAIIYLIDAAPFKYGGFSITSHHLNDLRELSLRMERLFLVFNKVDVLTKPELKKLKLFVHKILEDYNISKFLPHPPIFISAKNTFEIRNKKGKEIKKDDGIAILENLLWEHLLKNSKTGLDNIGSLIYEVNDELSKLSSILKTMLLGSEKTQILNRNLKTVTAYLNQLSKKGEDSRTDLIEWLNEHLRNNSEEILENLLREMQGVPLSSPLPNSTSIKQYLENNAYMILNQVYDEINYRLDGLYNQLNSWVKEELSQVELSIDTENIPFKNRQDLEEIIHPIRESFKQSIPYAVNILEKIFEFIGEFISGIVSVLEIIIVGKQKIRIRQINSIMSKARKSYFDVFQKANTEFGNFINTQYYLMIKQINDRTKVYLGDINNQLLKLSKHSVNEEERLLYEKCISDIEKYKLNNERIKNILVRFIR